MSERHYYMIRVMLSEKQNFSAFYENNVVTVSEVISILKICK